MNDLICAMHKMQTLLIYFIADLTSSADTVLDLYPFPLAGVSSTFGGRVVALSGPAHARRKVGRGIVAREPLGPFAEATIHWMTNRRRMGCGINAMINAILETLKVCMSNKFEERKVLSTDTAENT